MRVAPAVYPPASRLRLWIIERQWRRALPVCSAFAHRVLEKGFALDQDDAEDVVAHVLYVTWQADMIPDNPYRWLHRVTRNRAIELLATRWHRQRTPLEDIEAPVARETADGALLDEEHARELAEFERHVRAEIRRLPTTYRQALQEVRRRAKHSETLVFPPLTAAERMALTRGRRALAKRVARHHSYVGTAWQQGCG